MDDGYGGTFKIIYDTVEVSPSINSYLITNLTTALMYRFKIAAYNFNGAGKNSTISSY